MTTRDLKRLLEFAIVAMVLFSCSAVAYDPGLDSDGDENLGMAVVMSESRPAGSRKAHSIQRERSFPPSVRRYAWHIPLPLYASPLSLLGSPQILVPLRT